MFVNLLLPYPWGRGKRQVRDIDISCMRPLFLFFSGTAPGPLPLTIGRPLPRRSYKGRHWGCERKAVRTSDLRFETAATGTACKVSETCRAVTSCVVYNEAAWSARSPLPQSRSASGRRSRMRKRRRAGIGRRRRPGRGSPFSTFRNRFLLLAAVPAFSFPLPRQHTRGACVEEGEGSVSLGVRSVKEP